MDSNMPKLIKNLMLATMLSTSFLQPHISAMQKEKIEMGSPLAKPDVFTTKFPFPQNALGVSGYVDAFVEFITSSKDGDLFFNEVMQGKPPIKNIIKLRLADPASAYKIWYMQKYESGKASEEEIIKYKENIGKEYVGQIDNIKEQLREKDAQLVIVQKERDLLALSGEITNAQAKQIVEVFENPKVAVKNFTVDDAVK